MKKIIKYVFISLVILVLLLIIDLAWIVTFHRPLFGVQVRQPYTYSGIFYNVYNCPEYPMAQIKPKKTKFGCAISRDELGKVTRIVDTTKDIKNFACAEALEGFYEDDNYQYYYDCIKGKYILVEYESGYRETVTEALKYGTITISDLDLYNIDYIKYEK